MTDQMNPGSPLSDTDTERAGQTASGERMSTADFASTGSAPTDSNTDTVAEQRPRADTTATPDVPLFQPDATEGFRTRWTEIQTAFVDHPRQAVEDADTLVAETMKQLAQTFADARSNLEQQWQRGDDVSTEDLRQALQRYRSYFDRLLSL